MAPAKVFTWLTISFHAAEESVVPAFGKAPHAAVANETPAQPTASAARNPVPIRIPRTKSCLKVVSIRSEDG